MRSGPGNDDGPRRIVRNQTLCTLWQKIEVNSVEIHEYQAKEILTDFGVPIPRGDWRTARNRRCTVPMN